MPQLRKDPIVNRWVIVATERARRPAAFIDPLPTTTNPQDCSFCHGDKLHDIYAHEGVRVVNSGTPMLNHDKPFTVQRHGLYDVSHSYGAHEVVIETPNHIANMADLPVEQIKHVLETYVLRIQEHHKDPFIEYVLAYKNYGIAAGSRAIGHARSQIMAVPVLPRRVKDKIEGAKKYFDFHERCLFCDMVHQEIESSDRVIFANDDFLVIAPFAARFPFETWIIPKKHHSDFTQGLIGCAVSLAEVVKEVLLRFKVGLNDPAYNYMIQTALVKEASKYSEDYHWHIELMPRLTRVAGFERGTGFYICPIPPEMTAQFLKEVRV